MAIITLKGSNINTLGNLPAVGSKAKDFTLVGTDLSDKKLSDYQGKNIILNIFPSVNTGVCASSVRKFNEEAASLQNTVVLCISKDLPFAQSEFCAAQGIQNVEMLSDFRTNFGEEYGVQMADGPLKGLLSRSVVAINAAGDIVYEEQVPEITQEPDYSAALKAII
jgi:thiol peroxidase